MRKPRPPGPVTVGRILHYWTLEGERLVPNPAIVLSVGLESRLWVYVFFASGAGGRDALWAPASPADEEGVQTPREGHWSWPARV